MRSVMTARTWTVELANARALTRPSSSAVALSWSALGTATEPGLMLLIDVAAALRIAVSAAALVMSALPDACAWVESTISERWHVRCSWH